MVAIVAICFNGHVAKTSVGRIKYGMTASVEEVAAAVEKLSLADLSRLSATMLERMSGQGSASQQFQESLLLYAIQKALPEEKLDRYEKLILRRRAALLTEAEYEELLALTQEVEASDARRLELMARLSELRHVPLRTLMTQLNLPQRDV